MRLTSACACFLSIVLGAASATAQVSIEGYDVTAARQEKLAENRWLLTGAVELQQEQAALYADEVEWIEDENKVLARGNVVLTQGNNRIASDRAEFQVKTGLGTFYNARGLASVKPPEQSSRGGPAVPMMSGQETDVYFFGEVVEKLGTKKYRITNGGFSTCVQPTPRWELSAGSVVLNVDHYTLLKQTLFKVKGVPVFYLPILYYPTKEDGRATGFLIPTYGMSTIRGQTIHNAFFWAINRSHDATLMYDWYSKTGMGTGVEYRYNMGGGSDGTFEAYSLDQKATSYQLENGSLFTQNASRSFMINGSANQGLPFRLIARGRVNYFSSIATNQTFNTNVYDASRNNRSYGANVFGAWGSYSLSGMFDRSEWFNTTSSSGVTGSSPRITVNRNERSITPNGQLYFSLQGEGAHLDRLTKSNGVAIDDRSVGRFDFSPQVRYPFKKWTWFTVNSTANWRETYYTRSLDLTTGLPVDKSLNRQFFTLQAQAVGPSFTRVWDTPDNGYASRIKHAIEPYFTAQRTSTIDRFDEIIIVDGADSVVGGTTNLSYGINNRLYAKRALGQRAYAQEIVSFEVGQTYYTNAKASQYDPRYNSSYSSSANATNFSPIALNLRAAPTAAINATLRAEIDSKYRQLRTLSVNGSYNNPTMQVNVGWSHKYFIEELQGFNRPDQLDHYLNVSTNVRTRDSKYGANYSFNWDVLRKQLLQQRITTFYNAQCCGIAFEYQRYNFGGGGFLLPSDQRFFLSFTLAGLGNFSPFNGGLGGVPR